MSPPLTALVTGASSGIGASFCDVLAERSDIERLILVARRADRLNARAEALRKQHPALQIDVYTTDLSKMDQVFALVQANPRVDVVINCAGAGYRGALAEQDSERLLRMVDVNCRAVLALSRAGLPYMLAQRRG